MKNFEEYKYADISEEENKEIKDLENQFKSECGKDVVLIAYQEKNK